MRFQIGLLIVMFMILLVISGCKTQSMPDLQEKSQQKTIHSGDLFIEGTETFLIENEKYLQQGNIYINDNAKLIIKDSQFELGRGDVPTVHTYFFVAEGASLIIKNSTIFPEKNEEVGPLVIIRNYGNVGIIDSPTEVHLLEMYDNSQLIMINSEMIFEIGGLLQVHGGKAELINSTIGSLGLQVPADANLEIEGLSSGICYDHWDVHEMIPEAGYNLTMKDFCILEDNFEGEYEHGPYERGWQLFLNPNAHVKISNSEFRKIFIDLFNNSATFENLKMGIPSDLEYNNIILNDIIMMGQWPFEVEDSNLTLINSEYIFLQPSGNSIVYLKDTHLVEFIPRNFFGEVIFENGSWTNAGEIIGGQPYHSNANDFTIRGSLRISEDVRRHLQFDNAIVTREYEVLVKDSEGNPIEGVLIRINGEELETNEKGQAIFELRLDDSNYNKPQLLEVFLDGALLEQKEIDFFSETPIIIG